MRPMPFLHFSIFLLLGSLLAGGLNAQTRGRIPPNLRTPDQLDTAEGVRVITQFRQMRLDGDFLFDIELVHEPHRGDTKKYLGKLCGQYADGLRMRVDFVEPFSKAPNLRFLQWNGPSPKFWKWNAAADDPQAAPLEGEALHVPLLPGITYTPYDLQMPFLHWSDFVYEGTRRLKGRSVHYFLFYPPEQDPRYTEFGGVRVAIDADFNVAVRAETLDLEGEVRRRLEVRSVKKVDEQWIVSRIDLIDMVTRDRTQLRVQAARVGLVLPPRLFSPEGLDNEIPAIELTEL